MNKAKEMLPTALSFKSVYADKNKELVLNDLNTSFSLTESDKVKYQNLRKAKNNMRWFTVGFDEHSFNSGESQFKLDSEINNRCLVLSFPSSFDGFKDLLFIDFPKQFNLHNKNNDFGSLSTSEKDIIATFLYQGFLFDYNRVVEEAKTLLQFTGVQNTMKQNFERANLALTEMREVQKDFIKQLVSEVVETKSKELNLTIQLESDYIEHLTELKLNANKLTKIVSESIDLAFNLNFGATELKIDRSFLGTIDLNTATESVKDRAIEILDSYEESAKKCMMAGIKITGKSVAAHLTPPVSPPAITDAVKKNEKRIAYYLDKHPAKWKNIRAGLKPLQNIDGRRMAS